MIRYKQGISSKITLAEQNEQLHQFYNIFITVVLLLRFKTVILQAET